MTLNTTQNKVIVAATLLVLAAGVAIWQMRSPPLPGKGLPCQIECPKGHTQGTTWDAIYALPAANRYLDMSPNGKMTVKCPTCGEWSVVKDLRGAQPATK